jgi:hypothetical protein
MITYVREVPEADENAIQEEAAHIRAHLSSICHPDDDECAYANEVNITFSYHEGNVMITGIIDRQPDAPYLHEGFDPAAEPRNVKFTPYFPVGAFQ